MKNNKITAIASFLLALFLTGCAPIGVMGPSGEIGPSGPIGEPGVSGPVGEDAKTPYELYCELHPEYTGSEDQFYDDVTNGRLSDDNFHTVTFISNCDTVIEPKIVFHGDKIEEPEVSKEYHSLLGWFDEDGYQWNFAGGTITEDLTLTAEWHNLKILNGIEILNKSDFLNGITTESEPIELKYQAIYTYGYVDVPEDVTITSSNPKIAFVDGTTVSFLYPGSSIIEIEYQGYSDVALVVVEDKQEPSVPPHIHEYIDGECSCGDKDPDYVPPVVEPEDPDIPSNEEITVYYGNIHEWSNVYAYIWNEDNYYIAYPGEELTLDTETGYYSYTFSNEYTNIIFNDGDSQQTKDISLSSYSEDTPYYNEVLNEWVEIPDEKETIVKETKTITFKNNWLWEDVRVYFWGSLSEVNPEWPGYNMTLDRSESDYDFYTYEIPSDVTGYLFTGIKNDGSNTLDKSPDIDNTNPNFLNENGYWEMHWNNENQVNFIENTIVEPEVPEVEKTTTSLDFSVNSNRISYEAKVQQTWKYNNLTFINNKSESTTNIRDAVSNNDGHVRCYKNSEIVIQHTKNIYSIVFYMTSPSYAQDFMSSLSDIGCEVELKNDKEIVVTLNTPSKSLTISKLAAATRINSITVEHEK